MGKLVLLLKKNGLIILCAVCFFIITVLYINEETYIVEESDIYGQYYGFDNINGVPELIVPNYVHYVFFHKNEINFITFLSMVSAVKIQKPEILYVHTDTGKLKGRFFKLLEKIVNETEHGGYKTKIVLNMVLRPTHIYGIRLSSVYHASDIARMSILTEFGGIYLDTDHIVLKNLDKFRHFEMSLGWPDGHSLGTQILIAAKGARFLKLWLRSYTFYQPRKWYFNAGKLPTLYILNKYPELIHREKYVLGVELIHREIWRTEKWDGWKELYALHLLIRHPPSPSKVTEKDYRSCNCAFQDMANMILHEIPPNINFETDLDN